MGRKFVYVHCEALVRQVRCFTLETGGNSFNLNLGRRCLFRHLHSKFTNIRADFDTYVVQVYTRTPVELHEIVAFQNSLQLCQNIACIMISHLSERKTRRKQPRALIGRKYVNHGVTLKFSGSG